MEEKLSSGGTLVDRGIKVLRVIAGPLVKRTVSVMISVWLHEPCHIIVSFFLLLKTIFVGIVTCSLFKGDRCQTLLLLWSIYERIHFWTAVVDESEEWSSQ